MSIDGLPECSYMVICTTWMPSVFRYEKVGSSGTRITNGFKLPCENWELNSGPLQA